MNTDARAFFEHLTRLFGDADSLRRLDASISDAPPLVCFIYHNRPRTGMMTMVTYGLSETARDDWTRLRPEIVVCVKSSDESWGLAAAELAEHVREQQSFAHGTLLESDAPISTESEMSGFVAYAPRPDVVPQAELVLPGKTIQLVQLYPVFECEFDAIRRGALDTIWKSNGFDPLDVNRPHVWQDQP